MEIVALVPARGGSKGIPRKNLSEVNGLTLVEHAVLRAQQANCFSKIFVSTDDPEIARNAEGAGALVSLRSSKSSSDLASANDVVKEFCDAESISLGFSICYLQPTSPLLHHEMVAQGVRLHSESGERPVVGVRKVTEPLEKQLELSPQGNLIAAVSNGLPTANRQALRSRFIPTGGLYVFSRRTFLEEGVVPVIGAIGLEIPPEQALDIDSYFDLQVARLIARGRDETNN